ncbi:MAG: hypothetical protein JNL24_11725 [Bacteroidia bacterium]|nr:hypothetical protein [Bacteroidia bacterium]
MNQKIAEGTWDLEGFQGGCKEYYKNGKLKNEGFRNGDFKQGKWKYYNEQGEFIKEEEYDEKGDLVK